MLRNPPIPFEPQAVRDAISDLAANAAPYVRLGALKLMARILGMDCPRPATDFAGRNAQKIEQAIDEVMAIIHGPSSTADEEEAEEETEPL